jgi:hypothetical protein
VAGPPAIVLRQPQGVAWDGERLLIADSGDARVLAATASEVRVLAGTGFADNGGASGSARTTELALPLAVAADPDGSVLIADSGNHQIRRVLADGEITTAAGTGQRGDGGDGGPATAARLAFPSGVAALPDGGFVIADSANHRLRAVSPGGEITNLLGGPPGTSQQEPSGCRTPNAPAGLAVAEDRGIYFADTGLNVVCRIDSKGGVTRVAGTGTAGFSGDGGPSTDAELSHPSAVALTARDELLIADTGNNRVRIVRRNGRISTVAGTGAAGYSGDGGPATAATLSAPAGVSAQPDGSFVIADAGNDAIRRAAANGTLSTVLGIRPGRRPEPAPPAPPAPQVLAMRLPDGFRPYINPKPITAHAHARITVTYFTNRRATIDISVLRGHHTLRHVHRASCACVRSIALRALRAGRYTVTLHGRSGAIGRSDHAGLRVLSHG